MILSEIASLVLASTLEKQQKVSEHSLESESSQKLLFYLLEKMDKLDTKLDDRIDKLDAKLDDRIDKLDGRIDKLNGRIDKLDSKIDSRFLWSIGIMFTGFIGIITIMLTK